MAALLIVAAVAVVLGGLRGWFAPPPAYDWPVWAYRVALAMRGLLRRIRGRFRIPLTGRSRGATVRRTQGGEP